MEEGICKCGNKYLYMGLDMGCCIKCLDKMVESSDLNSKVNSEKKDE